MQTKGGDLVLNRQINVRIAQKDYDSLIELAKISDRTPAYIVRQAVIEFLKTAETST